MLLIRQIHRAGGLFLLTLGSLLSLPLESLAQAPPAPNYDRTGQLIAGIQCVTFADEQFEGWVLTGSVPPLLPFNVDLRIIGTATPGPQASCAAADGILEVFQVIFPGDDPGTHFCTGAGGDQMGCSPCPCGNEAMAGDAGGCLNSAGTSGRLVSEGSASVLASDLCFRMVNAAPSSFAVLLSGTAQAPANMANPCFTQNPGSGVLALSFDGLRCVVQNVLRHGGRPVDVNGEVGGLGNPWGFCSAGFPNSAFVAGQTRHFQSVYRDLDTAVCMRGLNTTQGTSISFTP